MSSEDYSDRMSDESIYLIAFSTVPNIGSGRLKLLMDFFGSAQNAWQASEDEMRKVGLPKDALEGLLRQKRILNPQQYVEGILRRGIKFITINEILYPDRLRNISDPPNVLFLKSLLSTEQIVDLTKRKIIGVVGTRKMTKYGEEVTAKLTCELVTAGFTIVSGMALGVDGVAHKTSLSSGGKTIAVLGAGVEVIYPPAHRELYNSIFEQGGVILSEVAPEKTVNRGIFPARNRIISGLSEAVLVTEGAIDSGSLITARAALDQGREVFAVPGPINSQMAEGTNFLLKQGAKLVTGIDDILETLGYEGSAQVKTSGYNAFPKGDTRDEQKIIDLLINEPKEFDELVNKSGLSPSRLSSLLSIMEVKGMVKNGGLEYRLL